MRDRLAAPEFAEVRVRARHLHRMACCNTAMRIWFGLMWIAAAAAQAPQAPQASRSLNDVAALSRYAAEDAKIAAPAAGERRVVFMGDSITDFWGRRYGKFFTGQPYINRGISGQVTPQMLLRFR